MMLSFVLLACLGQYVSSQHVDLPSGHDLHMYTDMAFRIFDHNPSDGIVSEAEWDVIIAKDDADNDTCVTFDEYKTANQAKWPESVSITLFAHYDHDGDQCLRIDDMSDEFHLMDHNGDNQVEMHEWEQYFTHLSKLLFGNGATHGHQG